MKNLLTKSGLIISIVLSVTALTISAKDNVPVETGTFTPDWNNLGAWECPEWYENAKFGIWAHWGPQCEAEDGDWYARGMYFKGSEQYNWHVSHFGDPSVFGLKDLCNAWKAEEWDPDSLIKLYKSVGAQYFMTLGEHHDNFDLWNSPYQEWNSVNVGPKRDIVKGWSDACKKYGLPLGVSIHGSHAWTWLEPSQAFDGNLTKADGYTLNADGSEKWWKGLDPQELYAQNHVHSTGWDNSGTIHSQWDWSDGASLPSEAYKMKLQNRVLELINDYDPAMLYFDDTVLPFYGCDESIGLNILADYYNHSAKEHNGIPQCVVMGKILNEQQKEAMLWDIERGAPDKTQTKHWQTCTCIGDWHYSQSVYNNNGYKSAETVIRMLVDIVSKNGNLLLNIPVRGNGTIDDKELTILKGIKAWMDVNKSSIYGTRPWKVYGEGPTAAAANPINSQGFNEGTSYSSKDIRFAQRNDTLFATIMVWPSLTKYTIGSLAVSSPYFSGDVKSASLLGYGTLPYAMDNNGLTVKLPTTRPNIISAVLAITFSKSITYNNLLQLESSIDSTLTSLSDRINDNTGGYSKNEVEKLKESIEEAKSTNASSDSATINTAFTKLQTAYLDFTNNGYNTGGKPDMTNATNVTTKYLKEAENFSRTDNSTTRFGSPKYWTVNNFKIPQTDGSGTKNGIDKYTGKSALMLGVWNDASSNTAGSLSSARIYQKVHLTKGKYYFGATYNTIYNLSDAYLFATYNIVNNTSITTKTIAYYNISNGSSDSNYYGINFTLDQDSDIYLGWSADLTTNSTQEFRADKIMLLKYDDATGISENMSGENEADNQYFSIDGIEIKKPLEKGLFILRSKGKGKVVINK